MPLFAQIGRHDDEDATLALGPALGDQQASFNGLAQANLVGQDHAFGKWIAGGEQRRVDLVRVQIHLRIQ